MPFASTTKARNQHRKFRPDSGYQAGAEDMVFVPRPPTVIGAWKKKVHIVGEFTSIGFGAFLLWAGTSNKVEAPEMVKTAISTGGIGLMAVNSILLISYLTDKSPEEAARKREAAELKAAGYK